MRAAVGMLLDAEWSNADGCFVKKGVVNGLPTHTYYDASGNYIPDAPLKHKKRKRRVYKPTHVDFSAAIWSQKLKDEFTLKNAFANVSTSNAETQAYEDQGIKDILGDTIKICTRPFPSSNL